MSVESIKKEYLPLAQNNKGFSHLKVDLTYNTGGYSVFGGNHRERGYYIEITPVEYYEKDGLISETITAFSGFYDILLPVSRKSKKSCEIAEKLYLERFDEVTTKVMNHYALERRV